MKIGIITFWQTLDNYGQVLQCYALQNVLKKLGHSPYLIKYAHSQVKLRNWRTDVKAFVKKIMCLSVLRHNVNTAMPQNVEYTDTRNFNDFKQKYLVQSDITYYTLNDLRKSPPDAECYIAGSDQIWAKALAFKENKTFFLDFGHKSIKRVSYAASFAMEEYPKSCKRTLKRCLKKFNAISVREKTGVEICKSVGIAAQVVLDPTLLLSSKDYINEFHIKTENNNRIFIYSINISASEEICWDEIKQYAKINSLPIIITPSSGYIKADNLFDYGTYIYANVPQWIELIGNSKVVITTSFHGIVFCILFHTNFVYFPLNGDFAKGNNRVLDLLSELSLSEKVHSQSISLSESINRHIDWQQVDIKLQTLRKSSLDFLKQSLN